MSKQSKNKERLAEWNKLMLDVSGKMKLKAKEMEDALAGKEPPDPTPEQIEWLLAQTEKARKKEPPEPTAKQIEWMKAQVEKARKVKKEGGASD